MGLSNVQNVVLWGFLVAVAFGAIVNKTNFCTMGAVSDWVNMGDKNRLRAWFLAIGVAILGSQLLQAQGYVDLNKSIYLAANFGWFGHLLGGFLFGVGMTLAGGCGAGSIWRAGEGHVKLWCAVALFAAGASLTRMVLAQQGLMQKLGSAVFLPTVIGWGGALALVVVVMAAWYLFAAWNEQSQTFSLM